MNRRSILKAAIGGIAAACGWKRAKAETITFRNCKWARITGTNIGKLSLPCWECGHRTTEKKCPNCGFDSVVQPDGSFLIPKRFNPALEDMIANRT